MPKENPICCIRGCDNTSFVMRICKDHATRLGIAEKYCRNRFSSALFHIANACFSHTDDCIVWPLSRDEDGYAKFSIGNVTTRGHVFSCKFANGEKPEGKNLHAAHTCGNRGCVNPNHLRWATPKENEADKVKHGVSNHGSRNGSAKLTELQVVEIYGLKGKYSQIKIGQMFGCSNGIVSRIHSGKTWSHLTGHRI